VCFLGYQLGQLIPCFANIVHHCTLELVISGQVCYSLVKVCYFWEYWLSFESSETLTGVRDDLVTPVLVRLKRWVRMQVGNLSEGGGFRQGGIHR
jgi:hypothetical protein